MTMRIVLGQAARATDEYLAFARQLGVSGVQLNTPDLPGQRRWDLKDLIALREKVESYGLRLEAIENIPNQFYENAMLGRAGRNEDIENMAATITNIGKAGIPGSGGGPCAGGQPTDSPARPEGRRPKRLLVEGSLI
jgi:mannonate dehydratase